MATIAGVAGKVLNIQVAQAARLARLGRASVGDRKVVMKLNSRPITGRMTLGALEAIFTLVRRRFGVTGNA